jgi:hypothetical protein
VSDLSASFLNLTSTMFVGEPAAWKKLSQVDAAQPSRRTFADRRSRSRADPRAEPALLHQGGIAASSPVAAAG